MNGPAGEAQFNRNSDSCLLNTKKRLYQICAKTTIALIKHITGRMETNSYIL